MAVMVEDLKASPKRELKRTKAKKFSRSSLLDVLPQGGKVSSYTAEDGTVRMKILVKKQDLKKFLNNATMNNICRPNHTSSVSSSPASSIEQRLYDLMRKKKANSQAKGGNYSSWRPLLQSIPEEH